MAWIAVIVAGLLEVGFATFLKLSANFTRILPSIAFAICALASFALLSWALKELPVGTAYAVWTGIGAAGTALLGIFIFNDPATFARLGAIGLIIGGVVLLNVTGSSPA
ncbi:MAG: multidrug efflux SMR transporter [Actinomycetes bacterium]